MISRRGLLEAAGGGMVLAGAALASLQRAAGQTLNLSPALPEGTRILQPNSGTGVESQAAAVE